MTWLTKILRIYPETAAEKVLRDKAFNIAKNLKYDGYQCGLALMINEFFNKTSGSDVTRANKFPIRGEIT